MTPEKKADGGPIHMFTGMEVDDGEDRFTQGLEGMSPAELTNEYENSLLRARKDAAKAEIDRRNSQTMFGKVLDQTGRYLTGDYNIGSYKPPSLLPGNPFTSMRKFAQNVSPAFDPINPQIVVKPDAMEMARLSQRNRGGSNKPMTPAQIADANAASSANAPQKKPAPSSAPVSGASKKEEKPASDGGLAALLQQRQDRAKAYEDSANALLNKQRGDKDELSNRDFNAALMQLGLGLAGSKSNSLAGGIAEAGIPALQQYTAAREGRRKDEGALTDSELAILSKSNEIGQAEDKAAQDAYDAQRKYEIDQRTLDIQQQEADAQGAYYRSRESSARNPYTTGQIAWARQIEKDILDPVKEMNISEDDKRLAREILFGSGGVGVGGGGADLKFDPATNDFAQ
jgi:hypothetical protein